MNYQHIYNQFIADRRSKEPGLKGYTERHHILPRSLGGSDEADNLIRLTASDHLFAHALLARIHGGKMWFALKQMCSDSASARGIHYGTNRSARTHYEISRIKAKENFVPLPHHKEIGNTLRDNPSRLEGLAAYHERTDISAIVKKRLADPEYYKRWCQAQADSWTDERKKAKSEVSKRLWLDSEYLSKMSKRPVQPSEQVSENLRELWKNPDYRARLIKERQSRADNPEWIEKMKKVNAEINSRPEVKAAMSKHSKKRWDDPEYKKNHSEKLRNNALRKHQPVRIVELDLWFRNPMSAALWVRENINPLITNPRGKISAVLNGRRKTLYNYRWEYV